MTLSRGIAMPSRLKSDCEMDQFLLDDGQSVSSPSGLQLKRRTIDSDSSEEDVPSDRRAHVLLGLHVKTQVIFCSRTHSQLSQFISELRRTEFKDNISVVALASRKVKIDPVKANARFPYLSLIFNGLVIYTLALFNEGPLHK